MTIKQTITSILLFALIGAGAGCSSLRKETTKTTDNQVIKVQQQTAITGNTRQAGPPVIIYKTTRDYSRNVPVTLNADGTKIVSYPAVSDVRSLPYPTPLADGFLLDNRGIGQHVAFLSYTYEEYAALSKTPTAAELFEKIIDKHPLVEIHFCGNRYQYKNLVEELNAQIRAGKFKQTKTQ